MGVRLSRRPSPERPYRKEYSVRSFEDRRHGAEQCDPTEPGKPRQSRPQGGKSAHAVDKPPVGPPYMESPQRSVTLQTGAKLAFGARRCIDPCAHFRPGLTTVVSDFCGADWTGAVEVDG